MGYSPVEQETNPNPALARGNQQHMNSKRAEKGKSNKRDENQDLGFSGAVASGLTVDVGVGDVRHLASSGQSKVR